MSDGGAAAGEGSGRVLLGDHDAVVGFHLLEAGLVHLRVVDSRHSSKPIQDDQWKDGKGVRTIIPVSPTLASPGSRRRSPMRALCGDRARLESGNCGGGDGGLKRECRTDHLACHGEMVRNFPHDSIVRSHINLPHTAMCKFHGGCLRVTESAARVSQVHISLFKGKRSCNSTVRGDTGADVATTGAGRAGTWALEGERGLG